MAPDAHTAGLIQPDYATKPVTYLRDVVLKAISFVDRGANGRRWFLLKQEEGGAPNELQAVSPLIKAYEAGAPDSWEVAYVVIAEPGEVDKQKDVWDEDEIRKACHEFTASGGLLNLQHKDFNRVGDLAESAIALVDMEIPTPDGRTEVIKKGSWYIAVKPTSPDVKSKIQSGEITGMSVQGSARREAVDGEAAAPNGVEKADKDNRAIPYKAGGEGIKRAQHFLGVEETEEYDEATEAAIMDWMDKKGVPGLPTLATLKLLLNDQPVAAPVEAAPAAPEVPVEAPQSAPVHPGAPQEAEKHDPYNPAATGVAPTQQHPNIQNGVQVGPQPGNLGLRAADITVESASDDLKAALGQALQEGNEALESYMQESFSGSQVGDLYGRAIPHAELWFMYSKFVKSGRKMIDAQGNIVDADAPQAPEVEKGAWTGSHGGHDPDAKNGNMENLVRTFGTWAEGRQSVAAKKLLKNGVVATPEAANRLAAWLKDQWLGSTKWRGDVEKDVDLTKVGGLMAPDAPEAIQPAQSVAPAATPEAAPAPDKNGETLQRVATILRSGGSPEHVMEQISAALRNKPVGMEGALGALKTAIAHAASAPEGEREEMIEAIVEDFSRYLKHSEKKVALQKSLTSFSEASATENVPVNPTNSPLGEEMDRAYIEENREKLSAAAEFITSILDGQSSAEVAEVAEVEKDAAVVADEKKKKFIPGAPEAAEEAVADAPEVAPEAPQTVAHAAPDAPVIEEATAELSDEGEDVTEDELIQVLNHVVETLDTLEDRVAQLETLEKKLDQVGELAKALDVTGQIDVLNATVTELSKALDTVVSSDEMEVVRKQLDSIASTPAAPSALPVDAPRVEAPQVEEVVKSEVNPNAAASIWADTFR